MSVSVFGLTPESVRAHMFSQWSQFSAQSSPTENIVEECIEEEAGELAGRLYAENIDAASIADDLDSNSLHSAAWLWCARTLRLMVALAVLRRATQADPELAKSYRAELDARLKQIAEQGATALGNSSLASGTADPDGPTTHINTYGLTVDESTNMSSTVPRLRRDDAL